MKSLLDPESIGRYADCIVKGCLSLGDGHDLILTCQPAHRELAVAIVEAAYRAGARSVETVLMDPYLRAARVRSAPDAVLGYVTPWQAARFRSQIKPETATCLISGESLPGALDGLPRLPGEVGLSGEGAETEVFFSDLSHEYVTINAEYTT